MVTLIVWVKNEKGRRRRMEVNRDLDGKALTHSSALSMARGIYAGMTCKVVNKQQRHYPRNMRSYSDMMQERV